MKRLKFKDIAALLGYNDNRSVMSWCKRHKANCFKDGKQWYLFEDDFNLVQESIKNPGNKKNTIFEIPKEKEETPICPEIEASLNRRYQKIQAKALAKEQANRPIHILQRV